MNTVTIELWLWLRDELQDGFESPSEMRSIRKETVEEGTTIGQLLSQLATRYPSLADKIFDKQVKRVRPFFVINYNDRVINPHVVNDQFLSDGDKITILPMYGGG